MVSSLLLGPDGAPKHAVRLNPALTGRSMSSSPDLRNLGFAAAFRAIVATGAHRWARGFTQGAGAILMLHHVRPFAGDAFAPNRLLEITPEFLDEALTLIRAQGCEIVPLDELLARLTEPRRTEPSLTRPKRDRFLVALTFDDGYRDNRDVALPILQRHQAPWTMYVTTGFADGAASLWWLELEEAVRRLPRITLTIGGRIVDEDAGDPAQKQRAFAAVYRAVRSQPETVLRDAVARLSAQAGIDSAALTRGLCLGWDELRALASEPGLTIGAHTLTHPRLARTPIHVAQPEMIESAYRLEYELGRPVRHFAYPVGDAASAGAREFALARDLGFASAVTTRPGHVFPEHAAHVHALPRVSLNGLHQNATALKAMLSGAPFWALNRGRRVNAA
jgi:peptidoglycan/xylan/chitin deacetylase (PgdA/CDA1 family)